MTVSQEVKILGVTWNQPRFWRGKPQMFKLNADEAIAKVKVVKKKLNRIKAFSCIINRTTQNIIVNTYLVSKINYGMVVMWDLIPKTRRNKMNSILRSCTKNVRRYTQQSQTDFFEVVSSYEPLGLRIIQRMLKIQAKLQRYYPEELERFDRTWKNSNYW